MFCGRGAREVHRTGQLGGGQRLRVGHAAAEDRLTTAAGLAARVEALIVTRGAAGLGDSCRGPRLEIPCAKPQAGGRSDRLRRCLSRWFNSRPAARSGLANERPPGLAPGGDQDRIARTAESRLHARRVACGATARISAKHLKGFDIMSKQFLIYLRIRVRGPSGQGRGPDLRCRARCHPRRRSARPRRLRDPGQDRRGHRRRRDHDQRLGRCRGAGAQDRARHRLRPLGHGLRRRELRRAQHHRQAIRRTLRRASIARTSASRARAIRD